MLTLACYNVNSIRARLDRVLEWLGRTTYDVVCLQELKVADERFPCEGFEAAGWHCAVHGQRTYNGVAILSRTPLSDVQIGLGDGVADAEARLFTARVGGIRIASVYAPNGQIVGSDKWDYKLVWLQRLRGWLERSASPGDLLALAGDFNVAPEDRDVARPDEWRHSVLCHPEARAALRTVVDWGLVDTVRLHHTGDGPYTWRDYRMLGFPKNNGLRIDHVLATPVLAGAATRRMWTATSAKESCPRTTRRWSPRSPHDLAPGRARHVRRLPGLAADDGSWSRRWPLSASRRSRSSGMMRAPVGRPRRGGVRSCWDYHLDPQVARLAL